MNVRTQLMRDETRTRRLSRKGFGSCLKEMSLVMIKVDTIANCNDADRRDAKITT